MLEDYRVIHEFKEKHPSDFKKAYEELKKDRIKDAIEACDLQPSCVDCAKCYTEFDDTDFIPCNNIRKLYGESIWWYKK